jgi:hypothetical protein
MISQFYNAFVLPTITDVYLIGPVTVRTITGEAVGEGFSDRLL